MLGQMTEKTEHGIKRQSTGSNLNKLMKTTLPELSYDRYIASPQFCFWTARIKQISTGCRCCL